MARETLAPAAVAATWTCVGPTNIGGRLTSLACDPNHPDRLWAGAAGGGVWFSDDGGATWKPQWHSQQVLNVGALAVDPAAPGTIYCGTGEANLSADSYAGVGIYRSTDGGATWQLFASCEVTKLPRRIGVIAIDPFDSSHILVGGVGFGEVSAGGDLGGLYSSRDQGATWARETFVSSGNYWCHSIAFHPSARGVVFATVTARGAKTGIYRSTDGGKTWAQLTAGLPPTEELGRISLALSPSSPDTMYALAADERPKSGDGVRGIFRSDDRGETWKNVAGAHFADEGQMSYGNSIVVHPTDPEHVLCGGVDLHRTTNGGKTWKQVTKWDDPRGGPRYAHADHHCLLMPPGAPGRVYSANDGGLDVSADGGTRWQNRSAGLAVTMYYDLDVAQGDGRVFGGGAQDNGTLITVGGGDSTHFELLGGDGGWLVFDPSDAGHVFASYYNMHVWRFRSGKSKDVSPPADDEAGQVWMAFMVMHSTKPETLFAGGLRVWRTEDDGDSWEPVSPQLDGSAISCIEVAQADPAHVYAATENGGFFRSLDGGDTWSANLSGPTLPGHTLTRLATSPGNAKTLFATFANVGHSHVFRSDDAGSTWQDVDKGRLPDVPHHSIALLPGTGDTLCVCNDVGVFLSPDGGQTWTDLSGDLPHAMVVDLVYHRHDHTLSAATYGRSIWRLPLPSPA